MDTYSSESDHAFYKNGRPCCGSILCPHYSNTLIISQTC